ncbi:MAG: hypothetical protein KAS32_19370 [Candidatus Peribacteraceae bacterium]|nr:hypothetical protein [Candidatus Peribacteraceae bacterium]
MAPKRRLPRMRDTLPKQSKRWLQVPMAKPVRYIRPNKGKAQGMTKHTATVKAGGCMRYCEICGRKIAYYSKKKKKTVSDRQHTLCSRHYHTLVSSSFGTGKSGVEYPVEANRKLEEE